MDLQILLLLGQDGITNGAIYALLALALVLVFAVMAVLLVGAKDLPGECDAISDLLNEFSVLTSECLTSRVKP